MTEAAARGAVVPAVLDAAGTCVVVDVAAAIPRVLHWGAVVDPGCASDQFLATLAESQHGADGLSGANRVPAILPEQSAGWLGTPGLDGHRAGTQFTTQFAAASRQLTGDRARGWRLVAEAVDESSRLTVTTTFELDPWGVLRLRAAVTNTDAQTPYTLNSMRLVLPVPSEASEILDFTGRHLRERTPQRHPFRVGTHLREGRRGRTGSDATVALAAGTRGFSFRAGEVWAVHTAWSGNHATFAELGLNGVRLLGGGEVLLPGEGVLGPGQTYTSPWLYATYGIGLDAISGAFHNHLRARPTHPRGPRPVVLNTWEAVYFEHNLESLLALAALGAKVGAERFVLDDGWFRGRRDDTAGLGDWEVDHGVWPQGLGPLVAAVRDMGMQFGLWFEPEMINEDSDLARANPEWILGPGDRLPLAGRNQQVLNLTIREAFQHVLDAMSALISEHDIDYVKWDHNRDLLEAGDRRTTEARVHAQTHAVYALMDELRRRHPRLEIESCSSGGGRIDLEVLQRTDRVWASDCLDPLERQRIQRWTGLVLPPELIGSHVGAPTAHTTARTHSLSFRAATALFGHFGIEWDLRSATPRDLEELAAWIALYKQERELLHTGTTVHGDYPDETYWVHGVISTDRRRALFAFVALDTLPAAQPGRVRLPGLDPVLTYGVTPIELSAGALVRTRSGAPSWWRDHASLTGRELEAIGLQGPMLYPEQALLFRLEAQNSTEVGG